MAEDRAAHFVLDTEWVQSLHPEMEPFDAMTAEVRKAAWMVLYTVLRGGEVAANKHVVVRVVSTDDYRAAGFRYGETREFTLDELEPIKEPE